MKQIITSSLVLLLLLSGSEAINCDTSGDDSTYFESIINSATAYYGKVRNIVASGCPNHDNTPINPNYAKVQSKNIEIAAYPCYSDDEFDVTCTGSQVGITLNGVSIFSKFAGGTCNAANDAVQNEGDSFDVCSGHAAPNGGEYHYHTAPSCLLDQLNDSSTVNINGHSPQIGWAFDGFPIYGPHASNGDYIYGCTHSTANATDCVDECNGHNQHGIDGFEYHYHILGPIGDLTTSPVSPSPTDDMSPYTIGCLKGVVYDWSIIMGQSNGGSCSGNGTASGYVPVAIQGVTDKYTVSLTPAPTNDNQASKVSVYIVLSLIMSSLFVM